MSLPFHNYIHVVSLFNMQNWKCEELANLKKIEPFTSDSILNLF